MDPEKITTIYIIGTDLVKQHKLLGPAHDAMLDFEAKYCQSLLDVKVKLEVTNDPEDLGDMRKQWQDMHKKISEANGIADLIPHELEME